MLFKILFILNYINFNSFVLFRIEVFDKDKFGKDKSLGKVELTKRDLSASDPMWFPLKGVKSGDILINTEWLAPGESPKGYVGDGEDASVTNPNNRDRKGQSVSGGKQPASSLNPYLPVLHVDLIKAKDLIKTDLIGKSDPYALIQFDNQEDKTPTMKNTQNPKWDHSSDFSLDPSYNNNLM